MASATASSVPSPHHQIKQYLRKHKEKWKEEKTAERNTKSSGKSTGQRSSVLPTSTRRNIGIKSLPIGKGRTTIDRLPDEILHQVFSYFGANDLLMTARVCKRWNVVANDNLLWGQIFQTYAPCNKKTTSSIPENIPFSYWKSQCITSCSNRRNREAFRQLKKVHPYTGLPRDTAKVVETCGVKFLLVLRDSRGEEYEMTSCGSFPFCMSNLIRWYSLQTPPLRELRRIQIFSRNPLFFDKGKAITNSPYQRSLLLEIDIRWDNWIKTNAPVTSDDLINLYILPQGLMLATWKGDGELAFVSACFHHHQLVQRCLHGSSQQVYAPSPPKLVFDDVDKTYGLHDYSCTVELHNQRQSMWSQQFRRLHCKRENLAGGYAFLDLIRQDYTSDHIIISQKLLLPWKTHAFKGRLENVALLDVTVLDEQGHPFWCVSAPVSVQNSDKGLSFDYSSEGSCSIKYADSKGKAIMELHWNPEREQYFVTLLQVAVSLQSINEWFSTSYR